VKFRIANTFTKSLSKLTGDEQKAVKTTAFDLQVNPASPGMQFHRIDRAKDTNFWSIRVSSDIRLIVHRTKTSLLLCYVAHHDDAYNWVSNRKLETHPSTGAAQLVEIRETIKEVTIPIYIEEEQPTPPKPLLFAEIDTEKLLSYGVPVEWLDTVREADEDTILDLVDHLPNEAAEALLDIATGVEPKVLEVVSDSIDPFDHPDALRRFRVMDNVEELERALEFPWEKWSVFLHPEQRNLVEKDYSGPCRVSGSAGTGKTIVALHRAVYLCKTNADARVLLTSFSKPLANALKKRLRALISNEPRLAERLEVCSLNEVGLRLYKLNIGAPQIASREVTKQLIEKAAEEVEDHKFTLHFLLTEWEQVVDAWQLDTWEKYRDVLRLGRKTR